MAAPTILLSEFDDFVLVRDTDVDENVKRDILAGPCRLYNIQVTNTVASIRYLKFYDNKAPTVGTTDPDFVVEIPASADDYDIPCNFSEGWEFANGCSIACVTIGGTGGVGGPGANEISVGLSFRKGTT